MVTAIEFAMEAKKVGMQLTPEERFEVFGDFNPDEHADEAEERWGDTDAYRESTPADGPVQQGGLAADQDGERGLGPPVRRPDGGRAPSERQPEAMDLAEEHRQQISQWFYECTYEIHTGLADMYVADPAVHGVLREDQAGNGTVT